MLRLWWEKIQINEWTNEWMNTERNEWIVKYHIESTFSIASLCFFFSIHNWFLRRSTSWPRCFSFSFAVTSSCILANRLFSLSSLKWISCHINDTKNWMNTFTGHKRNWICGLENGQIFLNVTGNAPVNVRDKVKGLALLLWVEFNETSLDRQAENDLDQSKEKCLNVSCKNSSFSIWMVSWFVHSR